MNIQLHKYPDGKTIFVYMPNDMPGRAKITDC